MRRSRASKPPNRRRLGRLIWLCFRRRLLYRLDVHPSAKVVVLAKVLVLQLFEQHSLKFAFKRVLFPGLEPEHEIARERGRDERKWQQDAEMA